MKIYSNEKYFIHTIYGIYRYVNVVYIYLFMHSQCVALVCVCACEIYALSGSLSVEAAPLPPSHSLPHAAMAPPAACHVCNACRTGAAAAAEQEEGEEGGNAEQRLRKLSTGPMILACH